MAPDVVGQLAMVFIPMAAAAFVVEGVRRHVAGARLDRQLRDQRP